MWFNHQYLKRCVESEVVSIEYRDSTTQEV